MEEILSEASEAGSSIVLLAGGEPFVRKEELFYLAGKFPQMIFPVFTNGTMVNDEIIQNLKKHRNIIPVLSIEGHMIETDTRRGEGVYKKISKRNEIAQTEWGVFRKLNNPYTKKL